MQELSLARKYSPAASLKMAHGDIVVSEAGGKLFTLAAPPVKIYSRCEKLKISISRQILK
jgi:hypothetical protein